MTRTRRTAASPDLSSDRQSVRTESHYPAEVLNKEDIITRISLFVLQI